MPPPEIRTRMSPPSCVLCILCTRQARTRARGWQTALVQSAVSGPGVLRVQRGRGRWRVTETVPPYRQIVSEVRRRIEAGELRPGDRVPSARAITRQWGVAIATATKVHAALRDEGLTVARPGVGTVVAGPAPRRDHDLTEERIVAAAIAIADADGLAELSMRRIATDLGVATMSLYRHV